MPDDALIHACNQRQHGLSRCIQQQVGNQLNDFRPFRKTESGHGKVRYRLQVGLNGAADFHVHTFSIPDPMLFGSSTEIFDHERTDRRMDQACRELASTIVPLRNLCSSLADRRNGWSNSEIKFDQTSRAVADAGWWKNNQGGGIVTDSTALIVIPPDTQTSGQIISTTWSA